MRLATHQSVNKPNRKGFKRVKVIKQKIKMSYWQMTYVFIFFNTYCPLGYFLNPIHIKAHQKQIQKINTFFYPTWTGAYNLSALCLLFSVLRAKKVVITIVPKKGWNK